jgi:hypothetical protein
MKSRSTSRASCSAVGGAWAEETEPQGLGRTAVREPLQPRPILVAHPPDDHHRPVVQNHAFGDIGLMVVLGGHGG